MTILLHLSHIAEMKDFDPMSHLAHNTAESALVRQLVRDHKSKSVKTRISSPAHPSATGIGRVSGLVSFFQAFDLI